MGGPGLSQVTGHPALMSRTNDVFSWTVRQRYQPTALAEGISLSLRSSTFCLFLSLT